MWSCTLENPTQNLVWRPHTFTMEKMWISVHIPTTNRTRSRSQQPACRREPALSGHYSPSLSCLRRLGKLSWPTRVVWAIAIQDLRLSGLSLWVLLFNNHSPDLYSHRMAAGKPTWYEGMGFVAMNRDDQEFLRQLRRKLHAIPDLRWLGLKGLALSFSGWHERFSKSLLIELQLKGSWARDMGKSSRVRR